MAESAIDILRKAVNVSDFPVEAISLKAHLPDLFASSLSSTLMTAALQDTINRVETGLRDSTMEALEAELASCKTSVAEAEKLSEERVAEAESALSAYRAAEEVAKEAEKESAATEKATATLMKTWDKQREDLAKATAVFEGALKMLLEGGWDGDDVKSASVQAVDDCLATCPVEKVLCKAAPAALSLKPSERHSFDKKVTEAVSECLQQRVTTLTASVETDSKQEKCAKAEALGLWALADVAREEAEKAMHKEADALESRKRAAGELTAAKKRLKATEESNDAKISRRSQLQEDKTIVEAAIQLMSAPQPEASVSASA